MGTTQKTVKVVVAGDSSGGQKALNDLSGKSASTVGTIKGHFKNLFSSINQSGAFGGLMGQLGELMGGLSGLELKGKSIGSKMAAIGAGIAGAGGALTLIGSKGKEATNQLNQAIENTGASADDYKDKIEAIVKSDEHYGHSAEETKGALQSLTQGLQDPQKAIGAMGEAVDLAAAKHESLTAAADQLVKVYSGKGTKILASFGITAGKTADYTKQLSAAQTAATLADAADSKAKQHLIDVHALLAGKTKLTTSEQISLRNAQDGVKIADEKAFYAHANLAHIQDVAKTATKGHSDAVGELGRRISGQGDAAADTFTGKLRALKAEVADHVEEYGQKYGPALTGVGAAMTVAGSAATGFSKILGMLKGATEAAELAKGAEAAADVTEATAASAEAAADGVVAVEEGLALAPILLIIAAIALVGVAIYELVTHWKTVWSAIKDAVKAVLDWFVSAWNAVYKFFSDLITTIVDFVTGHWRIIADIFGGPIGIIIANWKTISGFFSGLIGDVVGFFSAIPGKVNGFFQNVVDFVSSVPGKIIGFFANIGDDMLHVGENIVNGIIHGIENLAGNILGAITKHLPGGGVIGGALHAIGFANGGLIASPTLALMGEAGYPEVVVPLRGGVNPQSFVEGAQSVGMLPAAQQGARPQAPQQPLVVNQQINLPTGTPDQFARETTWHLGRLIA